MKTKILLLTLLLCFSYNFYSQNGQKNFIDQPYIEVNGQFETEVIPDEIYLTIILNENDKKGKVTVEMQEIQLINALKKLNIDINKSLTIQDFDGSFKKYFLASNKVTKTKKYQLLVSSGKQVGEVYQSLTKINISNIYIERVSHSEIEKYKRETKIKALQVAKEKALEYATAIDQSIGKAIFIQENYNNFSINGVNAVQTLGFASGNKLEEVKINNLNFQTIKLSASVQTKFILN